MPDTTHGDRLFPRRFALVRHIDYTGVSGVGVVAYGVVFFDGHVVLRWCSDHPATSVWESLDNLVAVHGHGDGTSVQWIDDASDRLQEALAAFDPPHGRRARRGQAERLSSSSSDVHAMPPPSPGDADRPGPSGPVDPQHPPATTEKTEDTTGAPADRYDPAVPPQRRTGGRHRRRATPSEESAGRY